MFRALFLLASESLKYAKNLGEEILYEDVIYNIMKKEH